MLSRKERKSKQETKCLTTTDGRAHNKGYVATPSEYPSVRHDQAIRGSQERSQLTGVPTLLELCCPPGNGVAAA